MDLKKYLPITLPVLYVGLKNNWLTSKEVITIINNNWEKLNCDEETLIHINVNEDDEAIVFNFLKKQAETEEYVGIITWQLASLVAIEQSELSIHEKLNQIELQWSRFEYPEAWRDFIYYMPNNEKVKTEEYVYQIFLTFLDKEKKILIDGNDEQV